MIDVASNGRFKHFSHGIDGGTHVDGDSFTHCQSCGVRLWKDTLMDTTHCDTCGVEVEHNYEDRSSVEIRSRTQKGGVNGGETPLQSKSQKSRLKYENSGRTRLYGGHYGAYTGEGDYTFGELDDSLIDPRY